MKIDHIAIAQNTEEDSDKFFVELLGLRKIRSFLVSADKMMNFFGVNQEYHFLRYEDENLGVEVVITNDNSKSIKANIPILCVGHDLSLIFCARTFHDDATLRGSR